MNSTRATVLCTAALLAGIAVAYSVVWGLREMKTAQADSTAGALVIAVTAEQNNPQLWNIVQEIGPKWHLLSNAQYDSVVMLVGAKHNLDVPRGWNLGAILTDPWGIRFELSIRKESADRIGVRVSSYGPDGLRGTADDITR